MNMKQSLRLTLALLMLCWLLPSNAQRYLQEVYPNVSVIADSAYGRTYEYFPTSITTAAAALKKMRCDIYQPVGDTATTRPLVIYIHTGSFLPKYFNGSATGDRKDSATVEMCKRFARRGYTVAAAQYRLGWNPVAPTVDDRKESIIRAVYRALQDIKACVRFFRYTADQLGNPFKIDTTRILLCGQGTGGYIAMGYVSLFDPAQILIPKFLRVDNNGNVTPMVPQQVFGDYDGFKTSDAFPAADTLVFENYEGYSSEVNMAVNMAGALGDISWITPNTPPIAAFHSATDPFAPDTNGIVVVPGTGPPPFQVVPVAGSRDVVRENIIKGNHAEWVSANNAGLFNDVYTQRAELHNEGLEGYFRFRVAPVQNPQAGPWDWWDSTTVVFVCNAINAQLGGPVLNGPQIHSSGLLTNPNMSKTKALAYIDTMQNYLAPRIMCALDLPGNVCTVGINNTIALKNVSVYPNPSASGNFTLNIATDNFATNNKYIYSVADITGRVVANGNVDGINTNLNIGTAKGMYLLAVLNAKGELVFADKLIVQ